MNYRLLLILWVLISSGCSQKRESQVVKQMTGITPKLLQLCIDSTLALDPGLNGMGYLLDVHAVESSDKQIRNKALLVGSSVKLVKVDSLIKSDSTWIKYEYFQNPIISIDKIGFRKDGTILINTSKIKASDGSIKIEMLFEKQADGYKCLKSKITAVS